MHIALDCRSVHRHMGGIGRAGWELASELLRHPGGHRITVILGQNLPESLSLPQEGILQVEAAMIDERFEQLCLPTLLGKLEADLYLNTAFSIPAVRTTRFQASIVHDVVFEERPELVESRLRSYLKKWSRVAALHGDAIITVSEYSKSRIQAIYGADPKRIWVIPNGLPPGAFRIPDPLETERVRRRYSLPIPYMLYLGSVEPKKGIEPMLEAFSKLGTVRPKPSLVLAGGTAGPPYDIESSIARRGLAGRVLRLGYVEEGDKSALIRGASAFVYPSFYEGFGIPPLEAMALGVPCVVSNVTSLPEVVGDAALLVNVLDASSFSSALLQVLTDSQVRKDLVAKGYDRAREFTWSTAYRKTLELCQTLEAA